MTENEAYDEYVNEVYDEYIAARAEVQAMYDALVADGKTSTKERITNEEYRAAIAKEQAAWVQFLIVHNE